MLAPGTTIDERYELICPIGDGGMAEVWVARQRGRHGFEKLFALKSIHSRFAEDPAFRAMFLDEARIAASIEHANVAQVFDLGETGSLLYLVMEYVDGESLASILAAIRARTAAVAQVPAGVALRIIADACAGLDAAHSLRDAGGALRGVVHRDISPQNILVSARGDVKVIDFGIALARDRVGPSTDHGELKGKLNYMAPEQARREVVGPFTDVFGAGATLFRLLTGYPAHDAGSEQATFQRLVAGPPAPSLGRDIPAAIAKLVARAMDPDPANRYPTALALKDAIERVLAAEGLSADVRQWVTANISDRARERRAMLSRGSVRPERAAAAAAPTSIGMAPDLELPAPRLAPRPLPPPAPMPAQPEPGFMDIGALAARPPAAPAPQRPPAKSRSESMNDVAPFVDPPRNTTAAPPPRASTSPKKATPAGKVSDRENESKRWLTMAVATIILVVGTSVLLLFLPMIMKARLIAKARDAGIDVTVDRVGVGFGGVTARGIVATAAAVPGVTVRVEEVQVIGFDAREIRIRAPVITAQGEFFAVSAAALRMYAAESGRLAGPAGEAHRVSTVGARITWNDPFGPGTRLSASDVGGDHESRGRGTEEVRGNVGRFELVTQRSTLGPWAFFYESGPKSSRVRVAFDPPVPDGPSAFYTWGTGTAPKMTVKIPRSPLSRLGVRPQDLGAFADAKTEIEVKLEGNTSATGRLEGDGRIDLFGVRVFGWKSPVDVAIVGSAAGAQGLPLDLARTTVTAGPFTANVTGAIIAHDRGVRIDTTWRTQPIACEKIARAEAKTLGPIASAIEEIARATRAVRVTGTAHASGVAIYDSAKPEEALFTVRTKETCGLALFGM